MRSGSVNPAARAICSTDDLSGKGWTVKGIFACGLIVVAVLMPGALPAADAFASGGPNVHGREEQANPHDAIERVRARLHLRTKGLIADLIDNPEDAPAIPKELTPFVRSNEIPAYVDAADLEETGRLDYILVVTNEDSGDRTMRIISRAASGALNVVLSRDDLTGCDECGGTSGGTTISVGKGAIEFQNATGSAGGGGEVTCLFRYSKASEQWLLVDRMEFGWDVDTTNETTDTSFIQKTAKDFGVVSLASADIFDRCG